MNIKIYKSGVPRLCFVLHEGEESSTISYIEKSISITGKLQLSKPYTTNNKTLFDVSELDELRNGITKKYVENIDALKKTLVQVGDFTEENERDILSLKKRIRTVAKRLSEADLVNEDESFKNRLHEIGELKKQLGSFKNEYKDDARKKNGTVKYNIKQEEIKMNYELSLLDLELLDKSLKGE